MDQRRRIEEVVGLFAEICKDKWKDEEGKGVSVKSR